MSNAIDRQQVGDAIGAIPSGCAILTAGDRASGTGILASWIQQAAFEPLMVTVAVKRGRYVGELVESSRRFALNLLGVDPGRFFKHFAAGFAPGEDAFQGLDAADSPFGPILGDAIASIQCELVSVTEAGDHDLLLGAAVGGERRHDRQPYVHSRRSGLSY